MASPPPSEQADPSREDAVSPKPEKREEQSLAERRGAPALSVAPPHPSPPMTATKGGDARKKEGSLATTAAETPHGLQVPLITPSTAATVATALSSASSAAPLSAGGPTPARAPREGGSGEDAKRKGESEEERRGGGPSTPETPWHIRLLPSTPGEGVPTPPASASATSSAVAVAGTSPPSHTSPQQPYYYSPQSINPSAAGPSPPRSQSQPQQSIGPYSEALRQKPGIGQPPSPLSPGPQTPHQQQQVFSASQLRQQEQYASAAPQHQPVAATPTVDRKRPRAAATPTTATTPPSPRERPTKRKRPAGAGRKRQQQRDPPPSVSGDSENRSPSQRHLPPRRGGQHTDDAPDSITRTGVAPSAPSPRSAALGEEPHESGGSGGEAATDDNDEKDRARIDSHRRRFGAGGSSHHPSPSSPSRLPTSSRKARRDMGPPLHHYFPLSEQVVCQPHTELDVRRLPPRLQPGAHSPLMRGGVTVGAATAATGSVGQEESPQRSPGEGGPSRAATSAQGEEGEGEGERPFSPSSCGGGTRRLKQSPTLDELWWQRFEELREFKESTGHCRVPQRYDRSPALGRWVARQRTERRLLVQGKPSTLTEEREKALEGIQFDWVVRNL